MVILILHLADEQQRTRGIGEYPMLIGADIDIDESSRHCRQRSVLLDICSIIEIMVHMSVEVSCTT